MSDNAAIIRGVYEAFLRGDITAVLTGVFGRLPHNFDLRDGKIVRFQQYTDTWQFAQATGVAPMEKALA